MYGRGKGKGNGRQPKWYCFVYIHVYSSDYNINIIYKKKKTIKNQNVLFTKIHRFLLDKYLLTLNNISSKRFVRSVLLIQVFFMILLDYYHYYYHLYYNYLNKCIGLSCYIDG